MGYRDFSSSQEELLRLIASKYNIEYREVRKAVKLYAKVVKELIKVGDLEKGIPFVKRIKFAGIGMFKLKERRHRKELNKGLEEYSHLEHKYDAMMFLYIQGWALFKWNRDTGFVFANFETGEVYILKEKNLFNSYNAVIRFSEILNERRVKDGLDFSYITEFKPVEIKKVLRYDKKGNFIEMYNNIIEAHKKTGLNLMKLQINIKKNTPKYNTTKRLSVLNDSIWFFMEDRVYNKIPALISAEALKHNFLIDMYDLNGNLLIKEIGKPFEAVHFIQATTNRTNVKVSPILRVLDTNYSMYGYKWKRSIQSGVGEKEKEN